MDDRARVLVAPSILAGDLSRLAEEIASVEASGADWLHWDVMDGHFVPNLTFGPPVIASARGLTSLFFDVHIMVEHPGELVSALAEAGANQITFHLEATRHAPRLADRIRERGMAAGVALNPQTPLEAVEYVLPHVSTVLVMSVNPGFAGQRFIPQIRDKIAALSDLRERLRLMPWEPNEQGIPQRGFLIEVDGGVSEENAPELIARGADVLVCGAAFFRSAERGKTVTVLRAGASR